MKKIIAILLCCTLMFSGCTSGNNNTINPVDCEKQTKAWLLEMIDGSFKDIEDSMSMKLSLGLPSGTLEEVFNTLFLNETFDSIISSSSVINDKNINVDVVAKISTKNFVMSTTFDKNNRLAGIFFSYLPHDPKPEETDDFIEEIIPIGEYKLNGLLTMPKDVKKPPVAIFISGSGSQGMNSTIGKAGNSIFKDIAHGLAEQGIASIRFDDRYLSQPQLGASDWTIFNESIDDVNSAIDTAIANGNFGDVYLIGHSQGGMIAPYIANNNSNVKGFISLAGTPRGLEDVILTQNINSLTLLDLSEEQFDKYLEPVIKDVDLIKQLESGNDSDMLLTLPTGYWHSLNQTTGTEVAVDFNCPALIMQGGKDFQVDVVEDYELWQTLLEDRENMTFKLYENLNHLFMPSNGIKDVTAYNSPANVDEIVINDIANWILGK